MAACFTGVLVESTGDISVQGASINDLSTDSFLAIPAESLGMDYFIMTYMYKNTSQNSQGPSELAIVATRGSTDVEITLPNTDIEISGGTIQKFEDGTVRVTLYFCQTLQVAYLL